MNDVIWCDSGRCESRNKMTTNNNNNNIGQMASFCSRCFVIDCLTNNLLGYARHAADQKLDESNGNDWIYYLNWIVHFHVHVCIIMYVRVVVVVLQFVWMWPNYACENNFIVFANWNFCSLSLSSRSLSPALRRPCNGRLCLLFGIASSSPWIHSGTLSFRQCLMNTRWRLLFNGQSCSMFPCLAMVQYVHPIVGISQHV